ncbi:O-antigen ligase family protein, partial [Bacteroidales bacterium MSK.15.36]|nr:O-antigen ligase family protein [Bacteroidales bacterium MSK.15.36]
FPIKNEGKVFKFKMSIFIIYFSLIIFLSTDDKLQTIYLKYNTSRLNLIVLIFATFFIALRTKAIYLDKILLFMTMRSTLLLIPYYYTNNTYGYWGNYLVTLVSILTYLLVINLKISNRYKFLNILFRFIGVSLTIQLIYNSVNLLIKYGVIYKHLIKLPIGNSNFIAAFLLPCCTFNIVKLNKSWKDIFFICFFLFGIFLTFSKGAIISLLIVLLIKVILNAFENKKIIIKSFKWYLKNISIIIVIVIFLINVMNTRIGMEIYINTIDKIINISNLSLNDYTSGRIAVYKMNLNRFFKHIFLGDGTGFKENFSNEIEIKDGRAHNWIIELLVQSGVIGFLLFIIPIFTILRRTYKTKNYATYQIQTFFAILSILIHGLVEPNLFSLNFDVLFWTILGISETENKYYYNNILK